MEFFTYILPNGIRCIYKRIKSPVAYTALTVNAGSRDELAREHGIAHFAEHMLFKGTLRRKAYHINNRLEKLGGELNAFTTKEETVIHATNLRSDAAKAAELISDIVFNSTFPAREIEREREVVLDEIDSYKDSPPERIYDEFEDLLFEGSSLGHNILGRKATVSRFSDEQLRGFTARCYNTDQMVFSVAANISQRAFVSLAERYFGDYPAVPREYGRPAAPEVQRFEKCVNRATHQAHCIIGARGYDYHNPGRLALSLLTNMLGGPAANSMLNTLLREKHGLTYNVDAGYTPYGDTGVSSIYFGTEKDKIGRCMELVEGVLRQLRTQALSARQLSMAKRQFAGQMAIAMENQDSHMLSAAKSYLIYNEIDSIETIHKKINALTPADIMEAASEVFGATSTLIYNGSGH